MTFSDKQKFAFKPTTLESSFSSTEASDSIFHEVARCSFMPNKESARSFSSLTTLPSKIESVEFNKALARKFAEKWYSNYWRNTIRKNAESSYKGLQYGSLWKKIDPNFDLEKMKSLSKINVHNLKESVYQFANEFGFGKNTISEFTANFSRLSFVLGHFNDSTTRFNSLKSLTMLTKTSQEDLVKESERGADFYNTQSFDIEGLSNNAFVFFKFQLNPKIYPFLRYHRSRFGEKGYFFPLNNTSLLRFGHIYAMDPLAYDAAENNVRLSHFQAIDLKELKVEKDLLREVKNGKFKYPFSKKSIKFNPMENIFYGPLILRGIALFILAEAYHMNPEIFKNLIINRNALKDKKIVQILDVLLLRAAKIQALIPKEVGTAFSEYLTLRKIELKDFFESTIFFLIKEKKWLKNNCWIFIQITSSAKTNTQLLQDLKRY